MAQLAGAKRKTLLLDHAAPRRDGVEVHLCDGATFERCRKRLRAVARSHTSAATGRTVARTSEGRSTDSELRCIGLDPEVVVGAGFRDDRQHAADEAPDPAALSAVAGGWLAAARAARLDGMAYRRREAQLALCSAPVWSSRDTLSQARRAGVRR